jgi:hypothetical protein
MQAYRAAAVVDTASELHIAHVPFKPGIVVEIIVLEPESQTPARSLGLSPEREAALGRLFRQSYSLGGQYPSREELHER